MKLLISKICLSILKPLASVLLRCGLTWKEFADISKMAFIGVATNEFGLRGRPTNISRVSILTGINRKEVKRIRDLLKDNKSLVSEKTTDATRLLSGWHLDPDFTDAKNKPLALPFGSGSLNFSELFVRYGGDTPEQTMVRELLNAGAMSLNEDGAAVVQSRYFMPQALSEPNLRLFGSHLSGHVQTLKNNIVHQGKRAPLFEGAAIEDSIHPDHIKAFNELLNDRGQKFLEEIDAWLTEHRVADDDDSETVKLGAGLYAITGEK